MKYKPEDDGITHINIYSKARTTFGRTLSNFALTPFTHPDDGKFSSIEGYWYWLMLQMCCNYDSFPTQQELDELRLLWGFKAKKYGKELCKKYVKGGAWFKEEADKFEQQIKKAFIAKVSSHTALQEWLISSEFNLPFAHYYVYDGKIVEPKAHLWQIDEWERIRKQLKIERLTDFVLL